jgi:hypothetical protein
MDRHIIIDDLISPNDAKKFVKLIDRIGEEKEIENIDDEFVEVQDIFNMPKIAQAFWNKIKDRVRKTHVNVIYRYVDGKVRTFKLIGLADYVTVSRHITPIGIHKDVEGKTKYKNKKDRGLYCFYKMVVYLNEMCGPKCSSGGTILYDDDKNQVAVCKPRVGRALIFDIRDFHSGAPIHKGKVKYLIGFRLLYREIQP